MSIIRKMRDQDADAVREIDTIAFGAWAKQVRGEAEALAHAHGKRLLTVPVNARHAWALERLLHPGYRIERAMVRMVLGSTDGGPLVDRTVDLARWAG